MLAFVTVTNCPDLMSDPNTRISEHSTKSPARSIFSAIGGHTAIKHEGHIDYVHDLDVCNRFKPGCRPTQRSLRISHVIEMARTTPTGAAPENLPPVDLMIVDDRTFGRIEVTSNKKVLDGEQIRIPDALRLIALKLHATRDPNRRTSETDWQDVAALLMTTNQNLEDPELRAIISQYGGTTALAEIRRRLSNS